MKLNKIKTTLLIAVFILSTLFIVPTYAGTEKDVIVAAADRLLDLQSTTDYGWDWIITGLTGHSINPSSDNLYGVTAHGLLDAYEATGDSKYYLAAEDVADHITAIAPGEAEFYRDDKYIASFDFRFLMRFGSDYAEYVSDAWAYQIGTPLKTSDTSETYSFTTAQDVFDAMTARYGTVVGFAVWQASDFGLAAYEMGDTAWAEAMAGIVANNLASMTGEGVAVGAGKALELFSVVNPEGAYDDEIADLVTKLGEDQDASGYWDYEQSEGAPQDTAYAVMGLVSVGETGISKKGALWLIENQEANGGWLTESVEISEVNSEAIQAIVAYGISVMLDSEYYHAGGTVTVTVADICENEDPIRTETVKVHATSDTDTVGIEVTLTETGVDTGIFEGSFPLVPPTPEPGPGELGVSEGDTITVEYEGLTDTATVDDTAPVFSDPFVTGPEFRKNTDTITLTAKLDAAGYTVTADFSAIDSEYTTGDEKATGGPTYTITYVIDEGNAKPDGEYTIPVTAEDVAGNTATYTEFSTSLDNTMPLVTDAKVDPTVIQPEASTTVTFTATVSDALSGVASVTIDLSDIIGPAIQPMYDDGSNGDISSGDGIYTYEWTGKVALEGDYILPITATDAVGNENDAEEITLRVIADLDDPVFVSADVTYLPGVDSARIGDSVVFTAVVTDELAGVDTVTIDATDLESGAAVDLTQDGDIWIATLTVGTVDSGTYELTLTATDFAANTATETVTVEVTTKLTGYYVDLEVGWNLFSLPLIPDDSSVEAVLDDVLENVDIVWGYKDNAWSNYLPAVPEFSTLTDMVDGEGYWVKMTAADTETVSGVELPKPPALPPVYSVYEGWNLIGFKAVDPMFVDGYLATIPYTIRDSSVCYGWEASIQEYDMVYLAGGIVDEGFNPGQGYWLYLTEDANIAPPTEYIP